MVEREREGGEREREGGGGDEKREAERERERESTCVSNKLYITRYVCVFSGCRNAYIVAKKNTYCRRETLACPCFSWCQHQSHLR